MNFLLIEQRLRITNYRNDKAQDEQRQVDLERVVLHFKANQCTCICRRA